MARGDRRKCKCCLKLFRPDRVTVATSGTARLLAADEPARRPAKLVGSANPRTRVTSATPGTSPGSAPGDRAILAIGASCDVHRLRYKTSQQHNPLIPNPKRPFSRAHRYKIS